MGGNEVPVDSRGGRRRGFRRPASVVSESIEVPPGKLLAGASPTTALSAAGGPSEFIDDVDRGRSVLRVDILEAKGAPWEAQARLATVRPVSEGDPISAIFSIRGEAMGGGPGLVEFVFERAGEPYTKSVRFPVETSPEWREVAVRFRAEESYGEGGAQAIFQLGYLPQRVEIAGFRLIAADASVPFADLPQTSLTYAGREPAAAWRTEAKERIRTLRMSPLTITVRSGDGGPVAGAAIKVTQRRSAFGFGSAVTSRMLTADGPDAERYRATVKELYSRCVIENGLKWPAWEAPWSDNERTAEALRWLREQEIEARGHVMVWPSWAHLPPRLKDLADRPEELREAVTERIEEIAATTRGLVVDWDVVNETWDNHDLLDIVGRDAMIDWFKTARRALPETDLYYNDYAGLVAFGLDTAHKRHFEDTVRFLIDGGAPIDGIGLQSHFSQLVTPPERILAELDRWAKLGLKITITEFDVDTDDEQLQGDYTRDFLTACFSHPAVVGILTWGFWEGAHWLPEAALFRRDWSPTPAGEAWRQLAGKEWRTEASLTADARGAASFRGFHGEYDIVIRAGGRERAIRASLPRGGASIEAILP